ncbi:MAG TPA: hypothetical protein VFF68_10030 [Anaerolineaceae bacterium]|nr:hypothetical protein [Anaerolineaceae bacterium]
MWLEISPFQGLYYYGKWINLRGDFHYDKKLMLNLVKQAEKEYGDCPFMDAQKARKFISEWPEIINPNEDERLSIWPPVIDKFESELLELGLSMEGPPPTPFGEEYPVVTDMSFFLELIDYVYGEHIPDETKIGLRASYEEICQQALEYFVQ